MLMRIMRISVAVLTAVVTLTFFVVFITTNITKDRTIPVFTIDEEECQVSVKASRKELLKGVTAYDEKDGDITDRVLIESISKFLDKEKRKCKITYVVADNDDHIVTADRVIEYIDYTPPKFTMNKSLVFSIYDGVKVTGIIGAEDCIDGDISQNVIIYSPDFEDDKEGEYTMQATVTNSKGDTSDIVLPVLVERLSRSASEIVLSDYLIYVKKGTTPKWSTFIKKTIDSTGIEADVDVTIKTDYSANKPGTYMVHYYLTDSYGHTGHSVLVAIVQE